MFRLNRASVFNATRCGVIAIGAAGLLYAAQSDAKGKVWTVDNRATELMHQINEGQKSGELTVKEAKKLRSDLADIAHHKHVSKGENNGQVSLEERNKLEAQLNKVSEKIKKLELEKRVEKK